MINEALLRGSLITFRRKCGNPNCRCAKGELHESPALSVRTQGKSFLVTLPEEEVGFVREAIARYGRLYDDMEARVIKEIGALQKRIAKTKARDRNAGRKGRA